MVSSNHNYNKEKNFLLGEIRIEPQPAVEKASIIAITIWACEAIKL